MAKQVFTSFEEIDQRLTILKLQREIDKEQLRLHVNRTKANFYPTKLLGGVGGIAQKLLISFVAKKLLKRFN
ncbi:DUF6327 family protein [Arenibacter sp. M-2]|uniref:DUF6327 family protein n=1 Tax=unclassified Arenibacter TaxID=2615047 RepID=UPI000D764BC4|nr:MULTISPECIES: DUF6327 family protein [unclassified Arenibacter]MDL5510279.1 DUF6327 family protein [Arenibacter sp. M-2]PXX27849.1 hypothetical protein C7972_106199 [Arenibacter sp. ARW7G5Y1]|tara:strand:- start:16556 stop:16771 length:216 start_codon:yes stop_codon:yes gene_type:complete